MINKTLLLCFIFSLTFSTRGYSQIESECYILTDAAGTVLASQNETRPRPVASLTKVAMALVVLDRLSRREEINPETEMIPVPAEALVGGANPLNLKTGDSLSINAALHAAILGSDNVSAYSLANYFGGVDDFVVGMNELADSLGMNDTAFINPHGLDFPDRQGQSTAADLARLGVAATKSEAFMSICGMETAIVKVLREGKTIPKTVTNTNHLLGQSGIDGMKTGTTRRAGACFIGTAMSGKRRLVCVVLNSADRFGDAQKLFDAAPFEP